MPTITEFNLARIEEMEVQALKIARLSGSSRWESRHPNGQPGEVFADSGAIHLLRLVVGDPQIVDSDSVADWMATYDPRLVMAIADVLHLAVIRNPETPPVPEDDHVAHQKWSHPEWEYTSTDSKRKGDSNPPSIDPDDPNQNVWERNDIIPLYDYPQAPEGGWTGEEPTVTGWRNWERHEYVDTEYWRRRRLTPAASPKPPEIQRRISRIWSTHPDWNGAWAQ